ncbi:MAG: hypothetical protein AAB431_01760 [Patescibacteria group bacterium]
MSSFLEKPAGRLLADALFEVGAVAFGNFTLKLHEKQPNAPLSPYFFNLRTPDNPKPGPLTLAELRLIGSAFFLEFVLGRNLPHDVICGIPNAGEPLVLALREQGLMPVLQLLKTDDGDGRRISGIRPGHHIRSGARVLLLDDVVIEADTKIEAITVLRDAGFVVEHLLVVIDRQQGGVPLVAARGVRTHSLFTTTELIEYYHQSGRIDEAMHERATTYLADPR